MVVHCVVVGCTNYFGKKPGLCFFRFPSESCSEKRAKWIAAVRRERWIPGKSARIFVVCISYQVSTVLVYVGI